jgi:hypothetical protein
MTRIVTSAVSLFLFYQILFICFGPAPDYAAGGASAWFAPRL